MSGIPEIILHLNKFLSVTQDLQCIHQRLLGSPHLPLHPPLGGRKVVLPVFYPPSSFKKSPFKSDQPFE